jgi:hypothetical protein
VARRASLRLPLPGWGLLARLMSALRTVLALRGPKSWSGDRNFDPLPGPASGRDAEAADNPGGDAADPGPLASAAGGAFVAASIVAPLSADARVPVVPAGGEQDCPIQDPLAELPSEGPPLAASAADLVQLPAVRGSNPAMAIEAAPPASAEPSAPSADVDGASHTPNDAVLNSEARPGSEPLADLSERASVEHGGSAGPFSDRAAATPGEVDDMPPSGPISLDLQPTVSEGRELPRPPSRYRPQLSERRAKAPPKASTAPTAAASPLGDPGTLEADLLLAVQPGGWGISLSLLLRRPDAMPEEISVQFGGQAVTLSAIDDGLFEPLPLSDAGTALLQGVAAETLETPHRRWVRTGRQIHVFSERPGVPGFASLPRVMIGQENLVLCEADLAGQTLECCRTTGSDPLSEVLGPGIPDGWRCFRGYRPQRPMEQPTPGEIYLALSPLPHAAIELGGGIATGRSVWIAGRPPEIRILGTVPGAGEVTIDGLPAASEGDRWTAAGWDALGAHVIRYSGLSRRYEIANAGTEWPSWPAHAGPGFSIAGALAVDALGSSVVIVRGPACWLLGARPGEAAWAASHPGGFAASAAPDFAPIWAISPQAGRRRAAPRLLQTLAAPEAAPRGASRGAVLRWCELLLDARPGSAPPGNEDETAALWREYLAAARALRRAVR